MRPQWVAKTQETSLFPKEHGGTVEERLGGGLWIGLPNQPLGVHFPLETNINPWMGSNMALESSTLAFKSHLNAHAMPACCPNLLKPLFYSGKLMYHCASVGPREPEMSFHISFPVVLYPPSAANLRRETTAIRRWGAICPSNRPP